MGVAIGLTSAMLFGLNAVFLKIGMRSRRLDNGLFMSVLINVLFLGAAMLFISLPAWSWEGFVGFVLAGLMTTWLGRGTSFMAVRLLGPVRQNAILVSAPLFAAITGWLFLGESITPLQASGGVVISVGVLVLLRSRLQHHGRAPQDERVTNTAAFSGVEAVVERPTRAPGATRSADVTRGFIVAVLAAVFFGTGFVARKWGLSHLPSAVTGAFIGASIALAMTIVSTSLRGRMGDLVTDNLLNIPWWFVAGGLACTVALFLQFSAFEHLPAWSVSLLQSTQAVWALLFTWLFLRGEEDIGWELLISIGLIASGLTIMSVQL